MGLFSKDTPVDALRQLENINQEMRAISALAVLNDGMINNHNDSKVKEHYNNIIRYNAKYEKLKDTVNEELKKAFRPEFLNRVDEIITFNHLTEENFLGIADIMLAELKQSLSDRGLTLTWGEEIRDFLVKKAYSVTYGARNLRRTIQRDLEDPISEKIIDSFDNPISSIYIRIENDQIVLETN